MTTPQIDTMIRMTLRAYADVIDYLENMGHDYQIIDQDFTKEPVETSAPEPERIQEVPKEPPLIFAKQPRDDSQDAAPAIKQDNEFMISKHFATCDEINRLISELIIDPARSAKRLIADAGVRSKEQVVYRLFDGVYHNSNRKTFKGKLKKMPLTYEQWIALDRKN